MKTGKFLITIFIVCCVIATVVAGASASGVLSSGARGVYKSGASGVLSSGVRSVYRSWASDALASIEFNDPYSMYEFYMMYTYPADNAPIVELAPDARVQPGATAPPEAAKKDAAGTPAAQNEAETAIDKVLARILARIEAYAAVAAGGKSGAADGAATDAGAAQAETAAADSGAAGTTANAGPSQGAADAGTATATNPAAGAATGSAPAGTSQAGGEPAAAGASNTTQATEIPSDSLTPTGAAAGNTAGGAQNGAALGAVSSADGQDTADDIVKAVILINLTAPKENETEVVYKDTYSICGVLDDEAEQDEQVVLFLTRFCDEAEAYVELPDKDGEPQWMVGSNGVFIRNVPLLEGENKFAVAACKYSLVEAARDEGLVIGDGDIQVIMFTILYRAQSMADKISEIIKELTIENILKEIGNQ